MQHTLYGGIEGGGTKFICAIGDANGTIIAHQEIPTRDAESTIGAVCDFFNDNPRVSSVGVGSFGPLDLNPASEYFGTIINSPKPGWSGININNSLELRLGVPIVIETDANCDALGEYYYGAAQNTNNFVYLTIGTGIGGSFVIGGKIFRGLSHLEMGHMLIPHEPFNDTFKGVCPLHGDCLEGIASGPALEQRWAKKAEYITDESAWDLEAMYLARAIHTLTMTLRPKLFVLGGGVMLHHGIVESIRKHAMHSINNYLDTPSPNAYIVTSSNRLNGVLGAIKLAALNDVARRRA